MILKSLFKYYLECLTYESYFGVSLTQQDIAAGLIEDERLSKKPKVIQKAVPEEKTCYIGYPLLEKDNRFLPLALWEYQAETIYPGEELEFHQYLYHCLTEGEQEIFRQIRDVAKANPTAIFSRTEKFTTILQELDAADKPVLWRSVAFVAERKISANSHIINELETMLKGRTRPTKVTEAYFNGDTGPNLPEQAVYNVVMSNYPQNQALKNQSQLITVIQGPPGTGKTQTILNLIAKELIEGRTVMVASNNNKAVDNVLEKWEKEGLDQRFSGFVRFGNAQVIQQSAAQLASKLEAFSIKPKSSEQEVNAEKMKVQKASQSLASQIAKIEANEARFVDFDSKAERLRQLQTQLDARLRSNGLKETTEVFFAKDLWGERLETNLAQALLETQWLDTPSGFVAKLVHKFWRWYLKTDYPRLKKALSNYKEIDFLLNNINSAEPLTSVAGYHDIVRYLNINDALAVCSEELEDLRQTVKGQASEKQRLYQEKLELDKKLLGLTWQLRLLKFSSEPAMLEQANMCITNLRSRQRLGTEYSGAFTSFQGAFPLVLSSNLSARRTVPSGCLFDLVIVDETSQCSITSIFSLMQMAKRICFIGDQKQLSHITGIDPELDVKLWQENCGELEWTSFNYSHVSAFDRAIGAISKQYDKKHLLSYHYRCAPSIINFSNQEFYAAKLRVMTNEPSPGLTSGGVHFVNVEGQTREKVNQEELHQIAELVDLLRGKGFTSIGVITPFRRQANALQRAVGRKATVGTIHTFQGGECEAIIFSCVVAPGATQNQIHFAQQNAELINVAVTRAIKLLILVGHAKTIAAGEGYLTKLANYANNQAGEEDGLLPTKMTWFTSDKIFDKETRVKHLFNDAEKRTYDAIKLKILGQGLVVYPKVPLKDAVLIQPNVARELYQYYLMAHLDFVIYDQETGLPVVAVEYDGGYHRYDARVMANDQKKDSICKLAELRLVRISSSDETPGWRQLEEALEG